MKTVEEARELFQQIEALVNASKLEEAWALMESVNYDTLPKETHAAFRAMAGVTAGLAGNHHLGLQMMLEAHKMGINNAAHLENIGRSFQMIGKVREGLEWIKKAHKLAPTVKSNYTIGYYKRMIGDDDYRKYFERAAARRVDDNPRDAYYAGLANFELKRYEKAIEHFMKCVEAPEVGVRLNSHYSLGDCYDGLDKTDDAWEWWTRANEMNKGLIGPWDDKWYYDMMEGHKQFPGKMKPLCDSPFIQIVGMPRCGSTMLESMLLSGGNAKTVQEWTGIHDLLEKVAPFPEGWFQIRPVDQLVVTGQLIAQAYAYIGEHTALPIIDKCLPNYNRLGFLTDLFSNSKFLWVKRNRNDVRLSLFQNQFVNHKYTNSLEEIDEMYDLHDQLWEYWKDKVNVMEVPYEEVVNDPEPWLRKICDFTGLEYSEEMPKKSVKRDIHTIKGHLVYEPVNNKRINRWKRYAKYLETSGE